MLLVAYRLNKWLETNCVSLKTVVNCVEKCKFYYVQERRKLLPVDFNLGN